MNAVTTSTVPEEKIIKATQESIPITQQKPLLAAHFHLVLHTKVAQSLFNGEWKVDHMGLIQFAKVMSLLWKACKEDDPYAEWFLLKTYEAIQKAKEKLTHYESELQQQLNTLRGIEIELMSNPTPLKQPLQFGTPFAYMMAMLIERVDYVNRQLYTLAQIGLIPENHLKTADLLREIYALFWLPREWRYTGVTRKDIVENNQKAQHAKKLLGDVPAAILNREIRFAFLPKTRGRNHAKKLQSFK